MNEEELYTEACLAAIDEVKRRSENRYNPTRWQVMVTQHGGRAAAKRLLRSATGEVDGGERLTSLGLDFLSVEWSVLNPRWRQIFDDQDRELAYATLDLVLREQGEAVRRGSGARP